MKNNLYMIIVQPEGQTKNFFMKISSTQVLCRDFKKDIQTKSGYKPTEFILEDHQGRKILDDDFIKAFTLVKLQKIGLIVPQKGLQFPKQIQQRKSPIMRPQQQKKPSIIIKPQQQKKPVLTQQIPAKNLAEDIDKMIQNAKLQVQMNKLKQQIDKMIQTAKFFIIKSCNQTNLERAKKMCLWATPIGVQKKLKQAFEENDHVLIFFRTIYSSDILGLARMQEKPALNSNKSIWVGVQNVNLGGNFKIKWLSRKSILGNKYQQEINTLNGQPAGRCGILQQLNKDLAKKIISMFDLTQNRIIINQKQNQMSIEKNIPQNQSGISIPQSYLIKINEINKVMLKKYKKQRKITKQQMQKMRQQKRRQRELKSPSYSSYSGTNSSQSYSASEQQESSYNFYKQRSRRDLYRYY